MSDALAKLWLTFAASMMMTGPSSRTMSSLFCLQSISFTPLEIEHIECAIWTPNLENAAAVVACFSVGIMLSRLPYSLSNVATFTLVARHDGLHTGAVSCYPFHCLLLLRITHPCSWRTRPARPIIGIWRLWNIAFYPLCVSSSYHVMVQSVPNCSHLRLLHSSRSVLVPLWAMGTFAESCSRLRFHFLINGSAFNYPSASVAS